MIIKIVSQIGPDELIGSFESGEIPTLNHRFTHYIKFDYGGNLGELIGEITSTDKMTVISEATTKQYVLFHKSSHCKMEVYHEQASIASYTIEWPYCITQSMLFFCC